MESKPRHCYGSWAGSTPTIASVLTPFTDDNLLVAAQIGITDVVYYNMDFMPDKRGLLEAKTKVESCGLRLAVVEGGPPMDQIVLAKEGRDRQIKYFKECLRNMGEVGIPILCYNFMPWSLRVARTSYESCIRGHALSSHFDLTSFDDKCRTADGETTTEEMWKNLEYFLKEIVPCAEQSGVYLAMHPDDPPLPFLCGLARILNTPKDFERMLSLYPSPYNGITFCQGCFSEMGVDIPETILKLGSNVHFVHFRDVIGTKDKFVETFQDEGQTDMLAALNAWKEVGFTGPIRPDHVPLLPNLESGHATGEKAVGYFSGKASGYTMMGRLFAVGYMRGLMHAVYGKELGSARDSSNNGLQTHALK
eukprot:TRINITY_DN344_c0_g2_i13.p1 TRINITY_DN344_c0_g2~~TRINITY_DN344_c0_g2_i13.p1  ORF type:complete len:364 (-),score=44.80 TRINITY_DN344_c0_g2_i13:160-1251(-)